MDDEIDLKIKDVKSGEALHLIESLLMSGKPDLIEINCWLYRFEILSYKAKNAELGDLGYAKSAVAILSYLNKIKKPELDPFLAQELNFRVCQIKKHGIGSDDLLNPKVVFKLVFDKLAGLDPDNLGFDWRDSSKREDIVKYRNIKNLLGPIESLHKFGITDEAFGNWLAVRVYLP